ncbi:MAG: tRNA (guanosine(46)-N7)-methyltransferase TrmB [Salibacteraceae bacterium]
MGKNKLKKFAWNKTSTKVIEPEVNTVMQGDHPLKGNWKSEFGNDRPIVLELACGKGEYTVGMATLFPEKNFIGIDIKGARIFSGAKHAEEHQLENVRFLRTRIDFINGFFSADEVSELWITFPDPQLQKPRKRLTSVLFLERYAEFLKPGATINLKTDSDELYEFTRDEAIPQFNQHNEQFQWVKEMDFADLYSSGAKHLSAMMRQVLHIRTHYEAMWLEEGKRIKFLRYSKEVRA